MPSVLPQGTGKEEGVDVEVAPVAVTMVLGPFFVVTLIIEFVIVAGLMVGSGGSGIVKSCILLCDPLLVKQVRLVAGCTSWRECFVC